MAPSAIAWIGLRGDLAGHQLTRIGADTWLNQACREQRQNDRNTGREHVEGEGLAADAAQFLRIRQRADTADQ